MRLLEYQTSLALSALTVLKLGTAITADAASTYYIPSLGTAVVANLCKSMDSSSEADPNPSDPEPPARGKTGGSRMRDSLGKVDITLISKVQLIFRPFERFPALYGVSTVDETRMAIA